MTSTVFSSGTVITAPWLNDVNTSTYTTVPSNTANIAVNTAAIAVLNSATGAANVGYTPAGTGAVATNVQAKLRQTVSVLDFGAKGDGVTNDASAFTAAWTTSNPKAVLVPAGTYLITGTVIGKFYSFGVVTISSGTVTSITNLVP
ncbi:Pectate lyase superfamily protein [uncultured Caudovirales phage]|uniref:Pectate lyase superfamily protein n=1 Tax=uncultured Caudovirales phage TaxID=2100421 RepID=A0A6J5LHP7_9CAUD|nr:Pectate lyase superfamily protein [uncultured Caudovirales phage]